jgi:hypothetical protein
MTHLENQMEKLFYNDVVVVTATGQNARVVEESKNGRVKLEVAPDVYKYFSIYEVTKEFKGNYGTIPHQRP